MQAVRDQRDLALAAWRVWGPRGLARRAGYEAAKRTGLLRHAELRSRPEPASLRFVPLRLTPPPGVRAPGAAPAGGRIRIYGGLELSTGIPPAWHRHPISHNPYPDRHWSELSDDEPEVGDIKDLWELSRLGWLLPRLRCWAAGHDEAEAELIWSVVEDWGARNPPYRGPNWMCGQETSLRAITVMFLASALRESAATTPERLASVARLASDSVGRVVPTMGYALSQRNNHAVSEAGFLWSATHLLDGLAGAERLRSKAVRALAEVTRDQFREDGSYAQHSPTYQRLALHVLLWCLLVARSKGVEPPPGVEDAVRRSVGFLRSLVAPGSEGRAPNLGGNDGALLFDLAPTEIGDLRPVIAHAAAATRQRSGLDPGPWDEEAAWFGLEPPTGDRGMAAGHRDHQALNTHALTRGEAHAVLRAGPCRPRPGHADQLHVDVWLAGAPVAVDPGSYRYNVPPPWRSALSGDDVHNLPRRPGTPQAVRAGRFFSKRWAEGRVLTSVHEPEVAALIAELELADGTLLHRLVVVEHRFVVVVDQASAAVEVRWNLLGDPRVELLPGTTTVTAEGWWAALSHGAGARVPQRSEDDPASGWHAPTYGVRQPLTALIAPSDGTGRVTSWFSHHSPSAPPPELLASLATLELAQTSVAMLKAALRPS